MANKCRFPIPAELMAVVGATLVSFLMQLGPLYDVRLVGSIPLGLPEPVAPPIELLRVVAVDAIAVTIVSFSIGISMALIFAQKQCYEVRANQELFAFVSTFSILTLPLLISRLLTGPQ